MPFTPVWSIKTEGKTQSQSFQRRCIQTNDHQSWVFLQWEDQQPLKLSSKAVRELQLVPTHICLRTCTSHGLQTEIISVTRTAEIIEKATSFRRTNPFSAMKNLFFCLFCWFLFFKQRQPTLKLNTNGEHLPGCTLPTNKWPHFNVHLMVPSSVNNLSHVSWLFVEYGPISQVCVPISLLLINNNTIYS